MHSQQFAPPEALRAHVRFFWTLESDGQPASAAIFRTIADGCPGLLFQQPHQEPFRDQNDKRWPRSFLYGQTTRPAEIYASGPFRTVGVSLQPGALAALFGLAADELTDDCLDLNLRAAANRFSLANQLAEAGPAPAQIERISAYLLAELHANRQPADAGMAYALGRILSAEGTLSMSQLQQDLRLSERSFQRRFKQQVGVPPKLFASICRFQRSLTQLRAADYDKLSDIAFEHEYADQSHYTRVFRQFAGLSPRQYRQRATARGASLPELIH